ncbi:hypothetical protein Tco_1309014 [Tanacetum coccineum]
MTASKFASSHNMVAFLDKPTESDGFEKIVDFLNAHPIKYALTVNPTIYTACIEQFCATAKVKTVNGEVQIQALVDKKKLTLIGYENLTQKITFYKAFFSPQWKFLIHTILQCLSAKTTAWNEFSSTMDSTVILFPDKQVEGMSKHKEIYVTPSHTKKVFANMKRQGKDFSGRDTPLFPTMIVQAQEQEQKVGRPARVVSSKDKGLGDQEDASKQGRKIDEIDQDAEVTLADETQGRYGDNLMFDTGVPDNEQDMVEKEVDMAEKDISTADPVTTVGEVVTTANVVVSTAKVTIDSTTTTTVDELTLAQTLIEIKATKPKARGVIVQEPSEFTTTTSPSQPSQLPQAKDQGKAKIVEPEKPLKKKDQIMFDKELVKGSKTRTEGSSKRAGEELESENLKKQKLDENVEAEVDDDQEEAEMKKHMDVVPDDEVAIDAIPLATKPPIIMLQNINREDLETLCKLVKAKHGLTRPEEGYESVIG